MRFCRTTTRKRISEGVGRNVIQHPRCFACRVLEGKEMGFSTQLDPQGPTTVQRATYHGHPLVAFLKNNFAEKLVTLSSVIGSLH